MFCFLQFDAMEQDPGILPGELCIFAPGYSEPGVGEKESGILEFEYCDSSLFTERTCWPRSFLLGKFAPTSSGYRTFPRYLPVSYSACHTETWPDTVHPTQGSQYRSCPPKSPAGGLFLWRAEVVCDFTCTLSLMCGVFCKSRDTLRGSHVS